jgi:hypothetical protein
MLALKRDPGAVGLDSLLAEIAKLNEVRRIGLPKGMFTDCSQKLLHWFTGSTDALALPAKYADVDGKTRCYDAAARCRWTAWNVPHVVPYGPRMTKAGSR